MAIALAAGLLILPAVAIAGTFGPANGPSNVHPGQIVHFAATGMLPLRTARVTIQPGACVGSNGCAVAVRGHWKTSQEGRVRVRFRFPHRYYSGCAGASCAEHPPFLAGMHAQVQLCASGPEYDDEEGLGFSCTRRTVRIVAR